MAQTLDRLLPAPFNYFEQALSLFLACLLVFASRLSWLLFTVYSGCQWYLVCLPSLFFLIFCGSFFFLNSYNYSGIHALFYDILTDTKSILNNLSGIQRPFLSKHAPNFVFWPLIFSITRPITCYILKDGYRLLANSDSFWVYQYDISFC